MRVAYTNWPSARAEEACSRLVGKAVSQVARTSDGAPVHGTLIFSMISSRGGSFPEQLPDLTWPVRSLPDELDGSLIVGALVLACARGSITECSAIVPDTRADFAEVACDQLKQFRPPVRRDAAGTPVPYVTRSAGCVRG